MLQPHRHVEPPLVCWSSCNSSIVRRSSSCLCNRFMPPDCHLICEPCLNQDRNNNMAHLTTPRLATPLTHKPYPPSCRPLTPGARQTYNWLNPTKPTVLVEIQHGRAGVA